MITLCASREEKDKKITGLHVCLKRRTVESPIFEFTGRQKYSDNGTITSLTSNPFRSNKGQGYRRFAIISKDIEWRMLKRES